MATKKKTWKQMLKELDTFLSKNNVESATLENILSALRGPDSGDIHVKLATTAIIREKAFPKAEFCFGTHGIDSKKHLHTRKLLGHGHFESHARVAFNVLGLKWDEVNE